MGFPDGFTYVQGKHEIRHSTSSSVQTIQRGNAVTLDARGRFVAIANSDTTAIYGVALGDSADSLSNTLVGRIPVLIPYEDTVFATKIQAGVSTVSLGQSYNIEQYLGGDGNLHTRLDVDSQSTPMVTIVQRGYDLNPIRSDDSTVFVQFLANKIGVFNSAASVSIFAEA